MNEEKRRIAKMEEADFFALSSRFADTLDKPGEETDKKLLELIRSTSPLPASGQSRKKNYPRIMLAAAAAVFAVSGALGLFFVSASGPVAASLAQSGRVSVIKTGREINKGIGDGFYIGEKIVTDSDSTATIEAGGAIIRLEPETSIAFEREGLGDVYIHLEYGELLARVPEGGRGRLPRIKTRGAVTSLARCMFVRYKQKTTSAGVLSGRAEIHRIKNSKKIKGLMLNEGEEARLGDSDKSAYISEADRLRLSSFYESSINESSIRKKDESGALLEISAGAKKLTLYIDGKEIQEFDDRIALSVSGGEHEIVLVKGGVVRYREKVRENGKARISLSPVLAEGGNLPINEHERKIMGAREIFAYKNADNPLDSKILGFAGFGEAVVAVTRTSVICFDRKGTMLWSKIFGEKSKSLFDSIPLVYGNTIYVSSYYKLMKIDAATGNVSEAAAQGMISDGLYMAVHGGRLLLPYPDGLYTFGLEEVDGRPKALITFQNPVTPLVTDSGIYLASLLFKNISFYSFEGALKGGFEQYAGSVSQPVETESGEIISGDESGNLYRLSPSLKLMESASTGEGIAWLLANDKESIFAFTLKGNLLKISLAGLSVEVKIKIDKFADPGIYLYKHPVLSGNSILAGTDDGALMAIDRDSLLVKHEKRISGAAVSTSSFQAGDALFLGTKSGSIIFVEYKKE